MAGAGGGAPGAGAGPLIPPTPLTETTGYKRKRDQDDISDDRIPQPPPPQSGTGTPINYLSRANPAKLRLIQDDNDAFSHVLSLMSDYEGVLSRHESLAANLGARLTAPRLLRAMEGLFESPITVTAQSPYKDSPSSTWYTPSWLDIVSFANANPADFNLTATADGRRVCRFLMNNTRVEISEADWRLVMSGTLDRFRLVPPHPLEEDEMAELATLEILEQRLHTLIKKADEVARRARQLNYHLSGRKAVIATRRPSSGQGSRSGHESANQQPPTRLGGLDPGYDLHADLLQQFLTPVPPVPPHQAPALVIFQSPVTASITHTPSELLRLPPTPSTTTQQPAYTLPQTSPTPTVTPPTYRGSIGPGTAQDPPSTALRRLIQARLDKLTREDNIRPPCDRCRRLRMACIKHRSACQGCTRKHARCTWNYVTDEEATMLTDEHVPGGGSPAATSGGVSRLESAEDRQVTATTALPPECSSSSSPTGGAWGGPFQPSHHPSRRDAAACGGSGSGSGSGSVGSGDDRRPPPPPLQSQSDVWGGSIFGDREEMDMDSSGDVVDTSPLDFSIERSKEKEHEKGLLPRVVSSSSSAAAAAATTTTTTTTTTRGGGDHHQNYQQLQPSPQQQQCEHDSALMHMAVVAAAAARAREEEEEEGEQQARAASGSTTSGGSSVP